MITSLVVRNSAQWGRALLPALFSLALSASSTARAENETASELPISVGVTTGVIAGAGPWRAAPSVDLTGAVGLGRTRFAIVGGVGGWSFAGVGSTAAQSEVVASLGAAIRGGIGQQWTWSMAAAPALGFFDQAQVPTSTHPGVLLAPTVEFSTRRKTLALTLGSRAFFFGDGTRLGAVAGVSYTFR
jgi:hypothetical protein